MNGRAKKTPSEIHIKRAVNGGFIVRHSYDNMGAGESYQPPQEHAFANHAQMLKHVGEHTLGKDEGAEEGTGRTPKASPTPPGGKTVAGVAGKAKAAAPNQRSYGAGAD